VSTTFDTWAIVELLGHRRLAGRVSEEERFGGRVGRLDVPTDNNEYVTLYFGVGSLYLLTPCSERIARETAHYCDPRPVGILDYRAAVEPQGNGPPPELPDEDDDTDEGDDDDDEPPLQRWWPAEVMRFTLTDVEG
jgi:hypothetical protein